MTAPGSPVPPGPPWPGTSGWPVPPPPVPPPGFSGVAPPNPSSHRSGGLLGLSAGLIFVGLIAFFGFALYGYLHPPVQPGQPGPTTPNPPPTMSSAPPTSSPSTPSPTPLPSPEPSYHQVSDIPPPDLHPPEVPGPDNVKQAKTWATRNRLYQQRLPVPTACTVRQVNMADVSRQAYEKHLNEVTACLWSVWDEAVVAARYQLPRPPVTVYTTELKSPCGTLETQNAFYCSANQRIYFAKDFYTVLPERLHNQPFVYEMILAHEFGHAVQSRTGILDATMMLEYASKAAVATEYNRRMELQADCFAGHWLGAIALSTKLSDRDVRNLTDTAELIGSPFPDPEDDHGSSESRRSWLVTGMQNATVSSCNTYTAGSKQVR